jgi:hypothetical protein
MNGDMGVSEGGYVYGEGEGKEGGEIDRRGGLGLGGGPCGPATRPEGVVYGVGWYGMVVVRVRVRGIGNKHRWWCCGVKEKGKFTYAYLST